MQTCYPTFRYSVADMGSSASCRAAVVMAEHRLWRPSRFSGAVSCSVQRAPVRYNAMHEKARQNPNLLRLNHYLLSAEIQQEGGQHYALAGLPLF